MLRHGVLGVALLASTLPLTQTPATSAPGIDGTWRGTLVSGPASLRLVLHITKAPDGQLAGSLDSLDQGTTIPIDVIRVTGDNVRLELKSIGGTFEGTLNAARTELKGTWSQGGSLPLAFTRAPTSSPSTAPSAPKPVTAAGFPLGLPLDLAVPVPPTPFLGSDGKTYLVYELHITNFAGQELMLSRVAATSGATTLVVLEGSDLQDALALPGPPAGSDRRLVPGGRRAVVFFWIPIDPASKPATLRHVITVGELTQQGGSVTVSSQPPVAIGPPLKGDGWAALNGPAKSTGHRRALVTIEGGLHIAQRFAIDWLRIGPNGRSFDGDAKDNKSYFAYGQDVIAVADAPVVAIKDGIPENIPGPASRAVPITLETVGGNYVVLDLGGGRFAFYAHLQPGSVRVKVGDRVKRGQLLGLVGNSGNSTEPHLHFHVSNGISPLGSEGLPYAIVGRTGMPLQNDRVDFGK